MLKVNIPLLMSALCETEAFALPEMNHGTAYLYENVYRHLCNGTLVRISKLDFDRFSADDICTLSDIFRNVLSKNDYGANQVINTLEMTEPVCVEVSFA